MLTPREKAIQLRNTFGKNAIKVVNQIVKYSPNRPASVLDPFEYFREVKEELKRMDEKPVQQRKIPKRGVG